MNPTPIIEEYNLWVDRDLSFIQAVNVCGCERVATDVTAEHFWHSMTGWVGGNVQLVCFREALTDDEINARFAAMGLCRVDTAVTLAFGARYPRIQCDRRIVSGVFWEQSNRRGFFSLSSEGSARILGLCWLVTGHKWSNACWFLAVRL